MNKQILSSTATLLLTTLCWGCAQEGFQASALPSATKKSGDTTDTSSCVLDATDYNFGVNIYSFAMSGGGGFNVGYSGGTGVVSGVQVGVKVTQGDLSLQMDMTQPYVSGGQSVQGTGTLTNSDFNFTIDLSLFDIGMSSQSQTSLKKLTAAAYNNALKSAAVKVALNPNPWQTRVARVYANGQIELPIGFLAGLKYGDQLSVYTFTPADAVLACSSVKGTTSTASIATLVPASGGIGANSTLFVLASPATAAIHVNDIVKIGTLYKTKKSEVRNLKKAIRLLAVQQPNQIVVVNASTNQSAPIDLTAYLNPQMASLTSEPYWVVP
jgi:hypothetical protein